MCLPFTRVEPELISQPKGSAIPRPAFLSAATVVRMVVQAVLTFSLLVAFTTSAASALCLQMEHHDSSGIAGESVAVSGQMAPPSSPSAKTCCYQQAGTPNATIERQRALPSEHSAAVPVPSDLSLLADRYVPPGLFDPALEKRDHLAPSLIFLSISRT